MLRLDPIADREEYAELDALLDDERPGVARGRAERRAAGGAALAMRIRNLGIDRWGVWARDDRRVGDRRARPTRRAASSLDLGSLGTREEQALVARPCSGAVGAPRRARSRC